MRLDRPDNFIADSSHNTQVQLPVDLRLQRRHRHLASRRNGVIAPVEIRIFTGFSGTLLTNNVELSRYY